MFLRWNADVYFETEDIHSLYKTSEFLLIVIWSQARGESAAQSTGIKRDLQKSFTDPDSKCCQRKCYSYTHDENGHLIMDKKEAEVIRLIFCMSKEWAGLSQIARTSQQQGIPSPRGKAAWSKESLRKALNNEKYLERSILPKNICGKLLES